MNQSQKKKKVVFLTGTRADFGKLKSLIEIANSVEWIDVNIFVTGMHMLAKYGQTSMEVDNLGIGDVYKYINQNADDSMDTVLSKTINGLSDYVKEVSPDLLVVHGDRVEPLAGAIVGSLNNILGAHIEGGEVSGTVDELLRHAISKMSHLHFVANDEAKKRLLQLGERRKNIYEIGSPDIDIMKSAGLPELSTVKDYYNIDFEKYNVVMFHPVTTDTENLPKYTNALVDALIESHEKYVVIYPNNDLGSDIILKKYDQLKDKKNFRVIPSMRFEYFLTLLKNSRCIVGNSSAGIREAPVYGIPTVNIGNRQHNRAKQVNSIFHCGYEKESILKALEAAHKADVAIADIFGAGQSDKEFCKVISDKDTWMTSTQKYFVDFKQL